MMSASNARRSLIGAWKNVVLSQVENKETNVKT